VSYLDQFGSRSTPQSRPIPNRPDQTPNSAGGYVFAADHWAQLDRFLILGSEGGTYYATQRKHTYDNVRALHACLAEDGGRTVTQILAISVSGRAPSNDPALFALACAIKHPDKDVRLVAGKALPSIARTGTHLYHFARYAEAQRGWGRMLRKAVQEWYLSKSPDNLAYDAIKYRQRDDWSHRDLLRLAHPRGSGEQNLIFDWITHGWGDDRSLVAMPRRIEGYELAQASRSPEGCANVIRAHSLPREAVPTEWLSSPEVWRALLETGMPVTAMVRNLGNMTRIGVLDSQDHKNLVEAKLTNPDSIHKSRIHPMALLLALRTYASGGAHSRGDNRYQPITKIIDLLDIAFYMSFDNVKPSGKRTLIGLDVSGSMSAPVMGSPLSAREAAVAMCLVTLHAEETCEIMAFGSQPVVAPISKRQRLDDAVAAVRNMPFMRTDCAIPFKVARRDSEGPEAFVVYTDNETWCGTPHPIQALNDYRNESGINARSAVVAMTSTGFSIADPFDPGMMDFVGFDTAAPALIADFSAGRL